MLIEKSQNGWELCTISNGKLSCDNFNLESDDIEKVESCIQQKFGNILKEEGIMVSWDNWSGIFIMQMPGMNTESSNLVIKEIYEFLTSDEFLYIKGGVNMGGRKYLEWDQDDFELPEEYKLGENADLADVLNVFWSAGGLEFFNVINPKYYGSNWLDFIGMLYEKIASGKYKISDKQYRVPLTDKQKDGLVKRGVPEVFVTDLVM